MPNWCENTLSVNPTNKSKKALAQLRKFVADVHDNGIVVLTKDANKYRETYLKENFEQTYKENADLYVKHKGMSIGTFMKNVLDFEKAGKEFLKGRQEFSMSRILPCPEELTNVTCPVRAENGENEEQFKARVKRHKKEYGAVDWYEWQCSHYGTKWDVTDVTFDDNHTSVVYNFSTAWSPPKEFLSNICDKYPLLNFSLHYSEPGMGFEGDFDIEAGEETNDYCGEMEQKDTCSDCGDELEDGEDVDEEGRCSVCNQASKMENDEETEEL